MSNEWSCSCWLLRWLWLEEVSDTAALLVLINSWLGISPMDGKVLCSLMVDSVPISSQLNPESESWWDIGVASPSAACGFPPSTATAWCGRFEFSSMLTALASRLSGRPAWLVGLQLSSWWTIACTCIWIGLVGGLSQSRSKLPAFSSTTSTGGDDIGRWTIIVELTIIWKSISLSCKWSSIICRLLFRMFILY